MGYKVIGKSEIRVQEEKSRVYLSLDWLKTLPEEALDELANGATDKLGEREDIGVPREFLASILWSDTCKQVLLSSRGLHGLRHSFAQERLWEMLDAGMTWDKALGCVSQQMGHDRSSEVQKTYLR